MNSFLQLDGLKKKYVKLGSKKMVSPTCFENIARTHARVPYLFPGWMVVHFESVRLEKMSKTLENLIEIMSPTYFEIVVMFQKTSKLFSNSDFSSIGCSRKK